MTRSPSDAGMDHIPDLGNFVERVARAICRSRFRDDAPAGDLDAYENRVWRTYAPEARAAIEAMREPTQEMIDAIGDEIIPHNDGDPDRSWRAGIDTALREGR